MLSLHPACATALTCLFLQSPTPRGSSPLAMYVRYVEGLGLSFIYCCHFGRTLIKAKRCFKACVGMSASRGASWSPATIKEDVGLQDSYRARQAQHCPTTSACGAGVADWQDPVTAPQLEGHGSTLYDCTHYRHHQPQCKAAVGVAASTIGQNRVRALRACVGVEWGF